MTTFIKNITDTAGSEWKVLPVFGKKEGEPYFWVIKPKSKVFYEELLKHTPDHLIVSDYGTILSEGYGNEVPDDVMEICRQLVG